MTAADITAPTARPEAQSRTVARPVANLGNTCYMNAVLQALAHAPELCMAMDCEPHHVNCPVAAENSAKLRASPTSSPEDSTKEPSRKPALRKSRRSGRKSPPDDDESGRQDVQYCVLCELEQHFNHVHDSTKKDRPVAPSNFVHGFIDNVAPSFKLGVQEDSHEFLRLLIDAMQKSCEQARTQDNPQDDGPPSENTEDNKDNEYPFTLFRGTVESNVICDSCGASSATLDPIEDIGLEATLPTGTPTSTNERSSRNSSPVPTSVLADVQTAFQRFARAEALDASYKCEKCNKVGRATKQSRLASIPPILTLHLKRFRYGDTRVVSNSAAPMLSRRTGRSEVSQLLGGTTDFFAGKSGSAKIEGHIKFDLFFDLKPYLTEALQRKHANMYCRLFAVIVHSGKNSHSGHYIAYVCSLSKNEWWKMDDGRVTAATTAEVMQAEAYMLFYRVVQHPVAVQLDQNMKRILQEKVEKEDPVAKPSISGASVAKTQTTNGRKRAPPDFSSGEDWIRKTNLPPHLLGLVRKAQEMVADDIQLSPEYFRMITEEASKEGAAIGKGPSRRATQADVVGGADRIRRKLCDLFYKLAKHFDPEGGTTSWLTANGDHNKDSTATSESDKRVAVVEPEDPQDLL